MLKLTFGSELEFSDWCLRTSLPKGFGRDLKDITIVNSNGIANDPTGRLYSFGGEINTPPTDTAFGQAEILQQIAELLPTACVNYRANQHIHVYVPGLHEDLRRLKRLALFNHYWLPILLPILEPIPEPVREDYATELAYRGARRRMRRRRRSHQTLLVPYRVEAQQRAATVEEFFAAEVPKSARGAVMWHAQPRAAVNVRHLLSPERTIEFRHFPGTLDWREMATAAEWCELYTTRAMGEWSKPEDADLAFIARTVAPKLPKFAPYDHALEVRYRATCHDHTLSREAIAENISAIEAGEFDDAGWERWFEEKYGW